MTKNLNEKIRMTEEKIKKIAEQLHIEEAQIKKSKEKTKKLKLSKAKFEKELQDVKFLELKETLQSFGIRTVNDLNKFLDNYSHSEKD